MSWLTRIGSLGALSFALASLSCLSEDEVEARIEAANYCEAASECVEVAPGCPLGCVRLINAAELDEVQALIDRFHRQHRSRCEYDCAGLGPPRCESGRCVADQR